MLRDVEMYQARLSHLVAELERLDSGPSKIFPCGGQLPMDHIRVRRAGSAFQFQWIDANGKSLAPSAIDDDPTMFVQSAWREQGEGGYLELDAEGAASLILAAQFLDDESDVSDSPNPMTGTPASAASPMSATPQSSVRSQAKPGGTVLIFARDSSEVAEGVGLDVAISRTSGGRFQVITRRFAWQPIDSGNKPLMQEKTRKIKDPGDLYQALESAEQSAGTKFNWGQVFLKLAELDWVMAAAIAVSHGFEPPPLPTLEALMQQRSLKGLGDVTIGVEWGYEYHDLTISFEQWIELLNGEIIEIETDYDYEGESFTAVWVFDAHNRDQLRVTYDGGAEGWTGSLQEVGSLEGPLVYGIDLVSVTLNASE
jgi:hypothetical protein